MVQEAWSLYSHCTLHHDIAIQHVLCLNIGISEINQPPESVPVEPRVTPEIARAAGSAAFIPQADPGTVERHLRIVADVGDVVEENLNRHIASAKDWHPHDYIPWSRGRDFAFLGGEDWTPEDSQLDPVAKTAMVVNLLTEDNLPSYHREIATRFSRDGAWGQWVGRWTAEEARHGIALRDYLVVTRGVDPVKLEALRMEHMTAGYDAGDRTALQTGVYVSFQEKATQVSHSNTGAISGDPIAEQLLKRIGRDEMLHMTFYRNVMAAAIERYPDEMMRVITDEVTGFAMPGAGMEDWGRSAAAMAKAGIYDQPLHHDRVIKPILDYWNIDNLPLTGEGDKARDELHQFLADYEAKAIRFSEQRDRTREKLANLGKKVIFVDPKGKLVQIGE